MMKPAVPTWPIFVLPPPVITSQVPYVVGSSTSIQTDPAISKNGKTDFGKTVKPGIYWWRVGATAKAGAPVAWSTARHINVTA